MILEHISCTIYSGNVADSVEDLESGQVDLMLGYYHYSEPEITNIGFASHRLGQSLLVPVVKTDSLIHRQLEKDLTASIPVIASTPNVYNRRILEFMRREVWQQKPEFDISLQCDNVGVIKSLTLQGVGVAWLPSLIIEQELASGMLCVVADDQWIIETDIVLYHQTSAANAAVHKVITALKQLDLSPPASFSVS